MLAVGQYPQLAAVTHRCVENDRDEGVHGAVQKAVLSRRWSFGRTLTGAAFLAWGALRRVAVLWIQDQLRDVIGESLLVQLGASVDSIRPRTTRA